MSPRATTPSPPPTLWKLSENFPLHKALHLAKIFIWGGIISQFSTNHFAWWRNPWLGCKIKIKGNPRHEFRIYWSLYFSMFTFQSWTLIRTKIALRETSRAKLSATKKFTSSHNKKESKSQDLAPPKPPSKKVWTKNREAGRWGWRRWSRTVCKLCKKEHMHLEGGSHARYWWVELGMVMWNKFGEIQFHLLAADMPARPTAPTYSWQSIHPNQSFPIH